MQCLLVPICGIGDLCNAICNKATNQEQRQQQQVR